MILGLLYYFPYSESFIWVLLDRSVVTWSDVGGGPGGVLTTDRRRPCHRWGDSETRPPSAPHWPALATSRWAAHVWTKTAPSEGKREGGDGKVMDWTKIKGKGGGRPRRRAMGAAPKLMAHGQIMEVTNKEKKTRDFFFKKESNRETRQEPLWCTKNLSWLTKECKIADVKWLKIKS